MKMMEVKTGDFAAVVKPFRELPAIKTLMLLNKDTTMEKIFAAIELMRDEIAVELWPAFDQLNQSEISDLLNQWMVGDEDES
jgi:hypothetical protein